MLGVFVNKLTDDENYPFWDSGDSQFPIESHLSEKQNIFSQFFVPLMEISLNFKHFRRKDDRDT